MHIANRKRASSEVAEPTSNKRACTSGSEASDDAEGFDRMDMIEAARAGSEDAEQTSNKRGRTLGSESPEDAEDGGRLDMTDAGRAGSEDAEQTSNKYAYTLGSESPDYSPQAFEEPDDAELAHTGRFACFPGSKSTEDAKELVHTDLSAVVQTPRFLALMGEGHVCPDLTDAGQIFRFLALPGELRNAIYCVALSDDFTFGESQNFPKHSFQKLPVILQSLGLFGIKDLPGWYTTWLTMRGVNKQIQEEVDAFVRNQMLSRAIFGITTAVAVGKVLRASPEDFYKPQKEVLRLAITSIDAGYVYSMDLNYELDGWFRELPCLKFISIGVRLRPWLDDSNGPINNSGFELGTCMKETSDYLVKYLEYLRCICEAPSNTTISLERLAIRVHPYTFRPLARELGYFRGRISGLKLPFHFLLIPDRQC